MAKRELSSRAFVGVEGLSPSLKIGAPPEAIQQPLSQEPREIPQDQVPAPLPEPASRILTRPSPPPAPIERRRRPDLITTTVRLEERQRVWLSDVVVARERAKLDRRDCDASAVLRELIDRAISENYK